MLGKDAIIKCPWCRKESTAESWNEESKKACVTREMRRAYRDLYDPKAFNPKAKKSYYMCPLCSNWANGLQLKVVWDKEEKYIGLGGEHVIKIVNSRDKNKEAN